ncbi:unnamed protein product [Acanthoscelides obtectus]|uniref:Uncharacterized protein n=1 Tax=Acanthoscelides obtectus TaxID=200917 RepID=A0A9P0P0D7_ACAOB|nr:unnamed protein product [Acanthoscelides obtectus]CAK1633788.1 hypothetical protein AOBTE_LOCUS8389 [Acanthoscelides obtectus]
MTACSLKAANASENVNIVFI